jgi:hypothetical protein
LCGGETSIAHRQEISTVFEVEEENKREVTTLNMSQIYSTKKGDLKKTTDGN